MALVSGRIRLFVTICLLIVMSFSLSSCLTLMGLVNSHKTSVKKNYYKSFSSDAPLEQKYSQLGPFTVENSDFPSENKNIRKYRFWYPTEIFSTQHKYPVIIVVNASGTPAYKYEEWFKRLASWGFVVVGNEDPQAGTGETTSLTLDYVLHLSDYHKFYGKLDTNNIGIIGFSQGGAGALAAVTEYENGTFYKAIFTGSAAYPFLASNMGWKYDVTKVAVPYLMVAGTGRSDDKGVIDSSKEFAGVAPLSSLIENYSKLSNDNFKVRARAVGAEHEDMLARSDGYMTAWMLYQLTDDKEAEQVFLGNAAEILHNTNWQDVEKNR